MEKATFGAGCFWGVEDAFRRVPGVVSTQVGYMGGDIPRPTYEMVCLGNTGHTEVVEVTYDPDKVSYEELLDVFWTIHNPTHQHKAQYKSVIFTHTPEQQAEAEAYKHTLAHSGAHQHPIATDILPATTFWRAEEYHQQYYEKTGRRSCG
jgi:peptide-methionine (S)-S-oxide reductase